MAFNYDEEGDPILLESFGPTSRRNKMIYLDQDSQSCIDESMITDEHLELIYGVRATRTNASKERLKKQLINDSKCKNEIRSHEGANFIPIPDVMNRERSVWFLSGPSGSGKSFFSADLIKMYNNLGIKRTFVITTQPDEKFGKKAIYLDVDSIVVPSKNTSYDDRLAAYKRARLKLKYKKKELKEMGADLEDIIDMELKIEEMKPDPKEKGKQTFEIYDLKKFEEQLGNSVWLFDDYENMPEEMLRKVEFLRNHLLTTGRHYNASLVICNHLTNFHGARLIHTETHYYVLFKKGTKHAINYFLTKYMGMDKQQLKRVHNTLKNSRWVCIEPEKKVLIAQQLSYIYE